MPKIPDDWPDELRVREFNAQGDGHTRGADLLALLPRRAEALALMLELERALGDEAPTPLTAPTLARLSLIVAGAALVRDVARVVPA